MEVIRKTENNNVYKALAVIESSEIGAIPKSLLDKLDDKMSYYSYSDYEQEEMNKRIIEIVKEANDSKKFCMKNGKIKPMNFNKMVKYIREQLR